MTLKGRVQGEIKVIDFIVNTNFVDASECSGIENRTLGSAALTVPIVKSSTL